jgi:hypothetical protein
VLLETENRDYAYTQAESLFIAKYQSNIPEKGYNMTLGGEGTIGYIPNDETREKMSKQKKGRKLSESHKKAISESNKGRVFSQTSRDKISQALQGNKSWTGKHLNDEHRQKISKGNSRKYKLISPNNEIMDVENMRQFCKENNLHPSAMSRVVGGTQQSHKKWKLFRN